MKKYIFVTGGVVSGLGKGITAASLGRLLKARGFKVAAQKLDPYMNVDPGTMSPYQHGEVFVTEDGAETDLDLGHYERFIDENLTRYSNLTSGKVYYSVLQRERSGGYLGETVQVIPHITNEIKDFIYKSAESTGCDILITEIGGTIGDIESQPFLEAIRQVSLEVGPQDCLFVHVTLVPYLKGSGEHKSKPTQHSVKELRALGIMPNLIVARSDEPIPQSVRDKIALFCNVKPDCVIENLTLPSIYDAPLALHENGMDNVACRELGLCCPSPNLEPLLSLSELIKNRNNTVKIALVGKYVALHDAYLSVMEALSHAGFHCGAKVEISWVDSEELTRETAPALLGGAAGIIVPGGFGSRGVEGMVEAARYAREHNIPYFGICLGMQTAVIEFARNVCGLAGAHSSEFSPETPYPVIDLMETQRGVQQKGGTMRLGAYPCAVQEGTLLHTAYGTDLVSERHRHRFEVNNTYRDTLTEHGLVLSGTSPDGELVEAVENPSCRFFVGLQSHPEFKSRPNLPHPVFLAFVKAALGQ